MKVTTLDTQVAEQIGHAFGYYDYGEEVGMGAFYRSKDAVATYALCDKRAGRGLYCL